MPDTFIKIASVTVGSGGASSIDFTSIPSTYTDLVIKLSGRQSSTSGTMNIQVNGDSGSNYSYRTVFGNGSDAYSQTASGTTFINPGSNAGNVNWSSTTSNTFSNFEIYIPNYAGSSNKSVSIDSVVENNATVGYQLLEAALWSSSSAITRVTFIPFGSETFVQYSTAVLYGIKSS